MTEHHGPVLCATELTATSEPVVALAARTARALGLPLVLCHALDTGADADPGAPAAIAPAEDILRARIDARVEAARTALVAAAAAVSEPGFEVRTELLDGRPNEAITQRAETLDARCIVIGPHAGDGALRRSALGFLLGSTADRVVRSASCPVLVAPRTPVPTLAGSNARWLVALDHGSLAVDVLTHSLRIAERAGVTITPIHAAESRDGEDADAGRKLLHDAVHEAHARVPGAKLSPALLVVGEPVSAILEAAESHHASLVVVGTHARRGAARALLGSVAERFLRMAEIAVLVVPPGH